MISKQRIGSVVLVVFLVGVGIAGATAPSGDGWNKVLVRLQVDNRAEQDVVGSIIDLEERTRGFDLWGWATEAELEELIKRGFDFERVDVNVDKRALTMCTSAFSSWECYPTYSQYLEMLDTWVAARPDIVRKVNIGPTTSGSRDLWAIKISDNPDAEEDEPEVFYGAAMHGNELVCYPMALHLIDYIVQNYDTDPDIAALVNGAELWINALSNPDGTFSGGNTTVSGATRYIPGAGVDPNRNFPDAVDGDHPDGSPWAAETVAMMDFADANSIVLSANCHSGTEVVNYPWDTWAAFHPDDAWFQLISHRYADSAQLNSPSGYMTGYDDGITNGYAWYEADGTRQDYMTYFQGGREVTLELSDAQGSFDANLLDDYYNYNRDALLGYFNEAFTGIRGLVTDAASGRAVKATVTVIGHDNATHQSWVFTDPGKGDYHRMIAPGTWDLEFTAEHYETETRTDVVVSNVLGAPATRLDVQMTTTFPWFDIGGLVTDASTAQAVEGALVELVGSSFDPVLTDGGGAYDILTVWAGEYTLRVSAAGYASIERAITVEAGSTTFDVALVIPTPIYEDDFEADNGGFIASGSWQWGIAGEAGAASGDKVWGTVLNGNYTNGANWTLDSPPIDIPADVNSAELQFAHWYAIEPGWDGGHVLVSVDGGPFTLMDPPLDGPYPDPTINALENQPGYTGSLQSWQEARFDLLPHAGHEVVIRWRFGSDGSQTDWGWYLDDVKVLTTTDSPLPGEIFADGFEDGTTSAWD